MMHGQQNVKFSPLVLPHKWIQSWKFYGALKLYPAVIFVRIKPFCTFHDETEAKSMYLTWL